MRIFEWYENTSYFPAFFLLGHGDTIDVIHRVEFYKVAGCVTGNLYARLFPDTFNIPLSSNRNQVYFRPPYSSSHLFGRMNPRKYTKKERHKMVHTKTFPCWHNRKRETLLRNLIPFSIFPRPSWAYFCSWQTEPFLLISKGNSILNSTSSSAVEINFCWELKSLTPMMTNLNSVGFHRKKRIGDP